MMPDQEKLERTIGADLNRAMPPVAVPADAMERMRRRVAEAQDCHVTSVGRTGTPAKVVALPQRPRPLRRVWRWAAAAVVAALLFTSGAPLYSRLERRWFGPQATFPISAPFNLGGIAMASGTATPALQHGVPRMQYDLAAALPVLPSTGRVERAEMSTDPNWIKSVKTKLGIKEPVTREWEGVPFLSQLTGYRAGALYFGADGPWAYWPNEQQEPEASSVGPAISDDEAVATATAWLKQADLYPDAPVTIRVERSSRTDMATVTWERGPESPLAAIAVPDPSIRVTVRAGQVFMAFAVWPKAKSLAGEVSLRTAQEAWSDLEAGRGVVAGVEEAADYPNSSKLTIRSVTLDRALVRSLDHHWYYIPIVVFRGVVADVQGRLHPGMAYVSAIKPTPDQGSYQLKANLPEVPGNAPLLQFTKPEPLFRDWRPSEPFETFTRPTPEQVKAATLRLAAAAGIDPLAMAAPEITFTPLDAQVPLISNGLPVRTATGDPVSLMNVSFNPSGSIRMLSLNDFTGQAVGEPMPLISPDEAWKQVQQGVGIVTVMNEGDYLNAHFAAHSVSIDRVELSYNVDNAGWTGGRPAEPTYFFWGKAVIGEDYVQRDIVVLVPAVRR